MQNHPLEIFLGRCVSSEKMVQRLGDNWAWRRPCSREFLLGQLPSVDKREINRLLSAFVGPESTSVDLGPAVSPVKSRGPNGAEAHRHRQDSPAHWVHRHAQTSGMVSSIHLG